MKSSLALITISTLNFLLGSTPVLALNSSLDISQYAHTAWTVRDRFSPGVVFAIAHLCPSEGFLRRQVMSAAILPIRISGSMTRPLTLTTKST